METQQNLLFKLRIKYKKMLMNVKIIIMDKGK